MRYMNLNALQAAGTGRPHGSTPQAVASAPRHIRSICRAVAGPPETLALVDLIRWPEGTRPKRGGVTKAALSRLKIADLRAELDRYGADSSGTKEQLAEKLLQVISTHHTDDKPRGRAPARHADAAQQPAGALPDEQQQTAPQHPHRPRAAERQPSNSLVQQQEQQHAAEQQQQPRLGEKQQLQQQQDSGSTWDQLAAAFSQKLAQTSSSCVTDANDTTSTAYEDPAAFAARRLLDKHADVIQQGRMPPLDLAEAERVAAQVGVSLDDLPPLVQRSRGQVYDVKQLPGLTSTERQMVLKAVRSGLALTVLGGAMGDAAVGECDPPCVGLIRDKDIWLFDAGEDAQRALINTEHVRPSKMHRIVITRQAPDAMLGLPGVLCVIGASRERGHENSDIPVHVYGPPGTGDFLSTMYECSNTFLEMPVVVHEFVAHAVPSEEMYPQPLNTRAKLWRALLPPDQLNPLGFVDGDLQAFMPTQGRAKVRKGVRAAGGVLSKNPRAGYRPMINPTPGDPSRTDLSPSDMTWTVVADEGSAMTAVCLDADTPTWGIVWSEADRQGNLNIERCKALGLTDGELYRHLKNGESVLNELGIIIPAPMVCSQDKPGRKVVLLPPCKDAANLGQHAAGADVMIAAADAAAGSSGSKNSSSSNSSSNSSSRQLGFGLGMCAQEWGIRHLVVTGMPRSGSSSHSSSKSGDDDGDDGSDPPSESDEQQQQQHSWLKHHPAAAAVVSIVEEQFTNGTVIPAREKMSLIVEENLGHLDPPPVDYAAKAQEARVTVLAVKTGPMSEELNPTAAARRQKRQEERQLQQQDGQQQQQQQLIEQQSSSWKQHRVHGGRIQQQAAGAGGQRPMQQRQQRHGDHTAAGSRRTINR